MLFLDAPCVLSLSPPKGGLKRQFLHIVRLPFISLLQVIVDTSNLVRRLIIASPSLRTTNSLSLKWAWSRHVIHFKFQGPKHTLEITDARIVKFLTQVGYI